MMLDAKYGTVHSAVNVVAAAASEGVYQTTPLRWVVLLVFCCLSCFNNFQWIIFSPITNRIALFYNIPATYVNWLPVTYNVVYVLGVFPVCRLYEHMGLKRGMTIGAAVNLIGAAGKIATLWYTEYWLLVVVESFSGLGQLFVLGLPPMIASVWFSDQERTFATAMAANASNLGIALGFFVSPLSMKASDDPRNGLLVLYGHQSVICLLILLAIIVFVRDRPSVPPSATANTQQEPAQIVATLRLLVANRNVVLLSIAIGLCQSVFGGVCVVLTQVLSPFSISEDMAGWIGLVSTLSGIAACCVLGCIIDKLRRYKAPLLIAFFGGCAGQVALVTSMRLSSLNHNALGFLFVGAAQTFIALTYPLGFEFMVELSHPIPEEIAGSALMWVNNLLTTFTTVAMSLLVSSNPSIDLATNSWIFGMAACFISGAILLFVREDRRRVDVERSLLLAKSDS